MPTAVRSITLPRGFRAAGGTCGLKASGKPDLMLLVADAPCTAAGVFTTNLIQGAPVVVGRHHVRSGKASAVIANSGNSNVATGPAGLRHAEQMCAAVARAVNCRPTQVLPASTGVIGRPLAIDKVTAGVEALVPKLAAGERADADAADAILTTDLTRKHGSRTLTLGRKQVALGGIAKGSGMIAPSLATMLAFVTTDADVPAPLLRKLVKDACGQTFNRVSVDTDSSTSDTIYVLASGAADHAPLSDRDTKKLGEALRDLCEELAYAIIKDGEGATKVMRVVVKRAKTARDAEAVGRAIADSPLVKCAVHGADPNWGRLAMAAGKSGARFDPAKLTLSIGDTVVFRRLMPIDFTDAIDRHLTTVMQQPEVTLTADLGAGSHGGTWFGCDLSRDYVRINADYTT